MSIFSFIAPGGPQTRTPAGVASTVAVGSPSAAVGGTNVLSVLLTRTSDGATASYSEATATALDNYVDPQGQFTMACKISGTSPIFPKLRVWFRRDIVGTPRHEVIVELGECHSAWSGWISGYTASVRVNGAEVYSVTLPYHFMFSRWRWQSAPRPVRMTAQQLIDGHYVFPVKASVTTRTTSVGTHGYAPMQLGGIYGDMPGVGGRPDIGAMTGWQAEWLCLGQTSMLNTVLALGDSSGTVPWHHRDENTHAPLNTTTYPHASMNGANSPSPFLPRDWDINPQNGANIAGANAINPDPAHMPALAHVPFLLTGDPYFLEELQFIANFSILTLGWQDRPNFGVWLAIRAHAWITRNTALAVKCMPDTTMPAWLLPKSYFVAQLAANRDFVANTYVNSALVQYTTFHSTEPNFGNTNEAPTAPQGTYMQPYMEEFEAFVMGYNVWMGFTDWATNFDWKLQNTLARTNGTSGWIRANPDPYRALVRTAGGSTPFFDNWGDAWTLTQSRYGLTYSDPNVIPISGNDIDYLTNSRAVLAMAQLLGGRPTSNEPYTWLNGQIQAAQNSQRWIDYKWAVPSTWP